MELSVIIPCYNEESTIEKTIEIIKEALENIEYEIIVINDGSTDDTGKNLKNFLNDNLVVIINHKINKGYGYSLKKGIRVAQSQNIVITDADSTYPNNIIPEMFKHYKDNKLDMIIGARVGKNVTYPLLKKIPKFFITKLGNYISGTIIVDINSGLRIFKKNIAMKFFALYPNGFSFTTTLTMSMLCKGYEVEYMPINYFKREGKSKIASAKDTLGFFSLLGKIAMYYNPLKFIMPFVILLCMISGVVICKDIIRGDLSQSAVLFPILTLNLFFLGLIADLIVRKIDQ